jgi:integrase
MKSGAVEKGLDAPPGPIRLELYRRHTRTCPDRHRGRNWLKCSGKRPCPLYCDGLLHGRRYRKSLGRDLGRANTRLTQIEESGRVSRNPKTLAQMVKLYIEKCRADKLAGGTVERYARILHALVQFAGKDPDLGQPFLATITEFRVKQPWKEVTTMRQNLIALRTFGNWAVAHGWIGRNWAIDLPADPGGQTQPFADEEVAALLAACNQLAGGFHCSAERARKRARAFLLVLLYTGLRVSDAVQLRRDRIDANGRLFTKIAKTGERIYLKVKPTVLQALQQLPQADNLRPGYYFWTTGSTLASACTLYRHTLKFVQAHAGIEDVRPHRFRDTFAKAVLDMGHPLSTLQLLLGHKNISTTERYYRHFSRQQQCLMDTAIDSLDFEKPKLG